MAKPSLDGFFVKRREGRWRSRLLFLAGFLVIVGAGACVSTDGFASLGGRNSGERLAREQRSPLFHDARFHNVEPTRMMGGGGAWEAFKEYAFGPQMRVPTCALPMFAKTATVLAAPPHTGLRVTWLGHSTALLEIDGVTLLTDPQWSERASPSRWVGPKRFHPPPLAFENLPRIDAVLISHDHYDHLDMSTVKRLAARGIRFIVPLGIGAHLERWGVPATQISELEWWQSVPVGALVIHSTPARHFSGRFIARDPTLWSSWSIVGPAHRVFFSGDTGQGQHFKAIGERLGPFDLALIEIGQWHPSWGDIHLGPVGALDAFGALNARRLLPVHWGTFNLAIHPWSEPAETTFVESRKRGVVLLTPLLGEPIEPTAEPATGPWWRSLPPLAAKCP